MAESADQVAVPVAEALRTDDIQGNILEPFKKPYQRFIFISFCNRRPEARRWVGELVSAGIASTREVVEYQEPPEPAAPEQAVPEQAVPEQTDSDDVDSEPHRWLGVSFTSSGLVTLDADVARDLVAHQAFWEGALADREYGGNRSTSPAVVGDVYRGDPTRWVVGGPRTYPVDALLTVAADDQTALDDVARKEVDRAVACKLTVLSWQDCRRLDDKGLRIEPFGFRDGISQPGIRGFTKAQDHNGRREVADQPGTPIIAAGEFVLGYDGEGGSYPDVRLPRPPDWMRDGSFQVFLRLGLDVEGWQTQMRELYESSGKTVDAAATAIGRTTDGKPLAPLGKSGTLNDFTFENDRSGQRTPHFAHIRKMNPRNGTFDDRTHRLLRRGIPFTKPLHVETPLFDDDHDVADQAEHGLVFNAFMASIENQFEFLQRSWASNPRSLPLVAPDGPDPVVGASDAPCVVQGANGNPVEIHFGRFVWTSGAVYAFAPSLSALEDRLASFDPVQVDKA